MLGRTLRPRQRHRPTAKQMPVSTLAFAERQLFDHIQSRYTNVHHAFRTFSNGNVMNIDDLSQMFSRFSLRVSTKDLQSLYRKIENGGPIRFHSFRQYCNTLEKTYVQSHYAESVADTTSSSHTKSVSALPSSGAAELVQLQRSDANSKRQEIIRQNHMNWLKSLGPQSHRPEGLQRLMREKLGRKFSSMSKAFLAADKHRRGYISRDDFRNLIRSNGIDLDESDLQAIEERYDTNGNGKISYGEFVRAMTPTENVRTRQQERERVSNFEKTQRDEARARADQYRRDLERMIEERKQRKQAELQRTRELEAREEREAASYNPWGRGGAGAPLRDSAGNILANFRTRKGAVDHSFSTVEAVPDSTLRSDNGGRHMQSRDAMDSVPASFSSRRARALTNRSVVQSNNSGDRSQFRFDVMPSHTKAAIDRKAAKHKQWQQDLALQIEQKRKRKAAEAERLRQQEAADLRRYERSLRSARERPSLSDPTTTTTTTARPKELSAQVSKRLEYSTPSPKQETTKSLNSADVVVSHVRSPTSIDRKDDLTTTAYARNENEGPSTSTSYATRLDALDAEMRMQRSQLEAAVRMKPIPRYDANDSPFGTFQPMMMMSMPMSSKSEVVYPDSSAIVVEGARDSPRTLLDDFVARRKRWAA